MQKLSEKEFKIKLQNIFPDLKIISNYINSSIHIIIEDSIGIRYRVQPSNLIYGKHKPTIISAIDKNKAFITRANIIHKNRYNYDKCIYKNNRTKIKIKCKKCNKYFEQQPDVHLLGQGCKKCGFDKRRKALKKSVETFIKDAEKIHDFRYNYSNSVYTNAYTKVEIFCNTCNHTFYQKPNNHLSGQGCPKCALLNKGWSKKDWENMGLRSKVFDSFKLYIIKCWSDDEEFFKIGKTFSKLQYRFHHYRKLPYNWKIITIIEGNANYISDLETKLIIKNMKYNYKPKKHFYGFNECFYKLNLNNYCLKE